MNHKRHPPPYHEKLVVALFGKRAQLKNSIGKTILDSSSSAFVATSNNSVVETNNFVVETNNAFKLVNTPDFFDEECLHPDQLIIDFMAYSHPGPHLFILAIDSENTHETKVVAQIKKLQDIFGEKITAHLVVTLPDIESFQSLSHLKYKFNTRLAIPNENLDSECKKWCSAHLPFLFDYKNYSEDVVIRRIAALEKRRSDGHPLHHPRRACTEPTTPSTLQHYFTAPDRPASPEHHLDNSACEEPDNIFNIVLLGLTGTGKSASANTILTALNSQPASKQLFKSEPSSLPVTTRCEVKMVDKPIGRQVRIVDTPDFLNDQTRNSQEQLEECKRYCRPGRCSVLLVLQLGRFTDGERGILEKLEAKLGWRIRESTVVLLTHGEDLKGSPERFIEAHNHLKSVVVMCGNRYHLFNNTSKNPKQVTELIKKIPNSNHVFPKFVTKNTFECCVV